jgi:hypothetical protein
MVPRPSDGGANMFERTTILRLRHFAEECRRAREHARDPLTVRELAEFELKFREHASNVETIQNQTESL